MSLSDLGWYLFFKFQQEADKLPPTFGSFKYKFIRYTLYYYGIAKITSFNSKAFTTTEIMDRKIKIRH